MDLIDPSLRVPLESLPVFPLPNTVLFPEQRLPLHIFEPRYRQMIRDLMEGSPYVVIARLDPNAAEPGAFSPVATVGRLVAQQRLPDGRFNILIEGTVRVSCEEITSDRLYRKVRCTALTEPVEQGLSAARAGLVSTVTLLLQTARSRTPNGNFEVSAAIPTPQLAWRVADRFISDAAVRQRILEATDTRVRIDQIIGALVQLVGESVPQGNRAVN